MTWQWVRKLKRRNAQEQFNNKIKVPFPRKKEMVPYFLAIEVNNSFSIFSHFNLSNTSICRFANIN